MAAQEQLLDLQLGRLESALTNVDKTLDNKTFLLNMKKSHIIEAARSKRENLLGAAVQAMESTFRRGDSDEAEAVWAKSLGKSLRALEGLREKVDDYSKEVKGNVLGRRIGRG